ncbi:hypothetical protein K458DRAFT_131818 [Lentithecium fluviatile CBS 122367]|uniref:Uncharacterized protein n=1 Tax=Lentithecium fluviatile CBS 122367 TaxID=1168545 RepID=A0A6G1JGP2_9PLEO|nr:hypothetical protein K458DRAFT_131818 [Lentithecium fluviatile CBS 122367]
MAIETTPEPKRDSMDAGVTEIKTKLQATTLKPPNPQKRQLGLTSLPPSVRNKIYAHVLDTELVNLGKPNVSYSHSIQDGLLHFKASRPPFPIDTVLFYVSKSISTEARSYFYAKNLFVKFDIYSSDARHAKTMLEDSGVLFATPSEKAIEQCKAHALHLTLVEKNSSQKRASVIFPAQYLPRLINFMEQAARASKTWAPGHVLFMTVANTYELEIARLQGDLLELFRMLTNIGAVTVEGEGLLPGYAVGLQASMTAADFDPNAWLSSMRDAVERAEEALKKDEYDMAAQHCQSVVIAMTYAYLTRAEALHMRPDTFHKGIQRLRYTTELTLGTALRRKHTGPTAASSSTPSDEENRNAATALLAAETATSQALSLATDSPSPSSNPWFRSLPAELIPPNKAEWFTDAERGRAWYEAGVVHLALGENLFAAGDLERAERLLVDGEGESVEGRNGKGQRLLGEGDGEGEDLLKCVKEAFERAREGIDWSVKPGMGLRRAMGAARGGG